MNTRMVSKVLLLWGLAGAAFAAGADDQVNSNISYGTFQNPSSIVRPRFRYWANDASLNLSRVSEDIRSLARAGAGGLQLIGYYLYGQNGVYGGKDDAILQSDWTVYGFGGTAWKNLQDTILATAKEEDIVVDFSIGPNQGAGVPAPYNDDGLLWDLAAFNVEVTSGTPFTDMLPGWGEPYTSESLVAASTGLVIARNGSQVTLSSSSLADVTSGVDSDGRLELQFNDTDEGSDYILFAFYLKHSEYREVTAPSDAPAAVPQSPIENYRQNGSWVVDHFSTAGAQLIIDFWNESLLTGSTTDDIRQVGNFLWEDSQEYGDLSNVFWTPGLPGTFQENRGYNISKYIPLIVSAGLGRVEAFSETYILDEDDGGQSHIEDYKQTLTELNALYLNTLTEWSNNLGVQFSSQVVYNLPMDMLANIPLVNGPECETLGFNHSIDGYRQFSGPANLAGKRIISSEAGAAIYSAYQQTIPELLWDLKRSIVGGINQFVLHGYPFSGNYGNTTWPGFTPFGYAFSEMHGPHQPSWEFYDEWLSWTARTQFIAQSGVPRIDLAFWSKLNSYENVTTQYAPTDLQEAGYTYEYLSPDNFNLPEAYVADGRFAPSRQAFKAMIVRANVSLTVSGVEKLVEYANQGLPIIFSGGLPSSVSGYQQAGETNVSETIEGLAQLPKVHVVPYLGLASSLSSLGIYPRTAIGSNGSWFTYWRDDESTSTQYVFVYNDATGVPTGQSMTLGNVSFEATGRPFLYDAWTGDVTALSSYHQSDNQTTVQLQLAGNQSVIIGFRTDENGNTTGASQPSTSMSDSYTLENWTLTVEAWGPPPDIYDVEAEPERTNSTYSLDVLVPWSQISESLKNISGRGYYHTTFDWPPTTAAQNQTFAGAVMDLGAIVHTARLSINGRTVAPLDPTWAKADIGSFLVQGLNAVDVLVTTPLANGLRGIWNDLETSGKPATAAFPDPPSVADYGLVQDVRILPYQ